MTLFTKPKSEVYNVLHCRQWRIEPQVTCTENYVLFGHVVFEKCEWTDRHTDMPITILRTSPTGRVIIKVVVQLNRLPSTASKSALGLKWEGVMQMLFSIVRV